MLKTKPRLELDRMLTGFLVLKPDCFRVLPLGKRQHLLHQPPTQAAPMKSVEDIKPLRFKRKNDFPSPSETATHISRHSFRRSSRQSMRRYDRAPRARRRELEHPEVFTAVVVCVEPPS